MRIRRRHNRLREMKAPKSGAGGDWEDLYKRNSIFNWMGPPVLLGGRRAILGPAPSSGQAHA